MLKRVDFFCSCYKKRSGGDESAESRGVPSEPLNWDGTSYHKLKAKEMLTFLFAPHMEKKRKVIYLATVYSSKKWDNQEGKKKKNHRFVCEMKLWDDSRTNFLLGLRTQQ